MVMFQAIGIFLLAMLTLGIGSCIYNVSTAAKNQQMQVLTNQKLIIHTTDGDFGFDFSKVKSIEVVH